jgi:hypothetical protein
MTDAQMKAVRNMAYFRAWLMRSENKWPLEEENAFFNGVMTAFFACPNNVNVPAFWIMGNGPVLDVLVHWKAEGQLQEGG